MVKGLALGDDNQSLYFLDRHITKERYENSINTFSRYSASDSDLSKLSNSDDILHPIIFIIHDGKLYIPPIFYSISDNFFIVYERKNKNYKSSMVYERVQTFAHN